MSMTSVESHTPSKRPLHRDDTVMLSSPQSPRTLLKVRRTASTPHPHAGAHCSPSLTPRTHRAGQPNTPYKRHTPYGSSPLDSAVSFSDVTVADMAVQAINAVQKNCSEDQLQRLNSAVHMPQESLLTRSELTELVDIAVRKFEKLARVRYENGVKTVAADQQEKFDKFNEDYVSRKLSRSDYSYMS